MSTEATTSPRKEAAGVTKRSSSYTVDPRKVCRRPGWNPRFHFEEIEELARSIKVHGMLNDIRVKRLPAVSVMRDQGFEFELIDGDRRLTACELLLKWHAEGKPEGFDFPEGIPAKIVDKSQDDLTSLFQMFEANNGKPFLPMEEAAAYKRMQDAGLTIQDICGRVGRAQVHVVEMLNLIKADDSVKEAVEKGEIKKTMAKRIATVARGDAAKQKELVAAAKKAAKEPAGKKSQVNRKIEKARQEKAAKRGKTVKVKPLSSVEIDELGARLGKLTALKLKEAGRDPEEDPTAWIKEDDKLAAACSFGMLQALKVVAGLEIELDI